MINGNILTDSSDPSVTNTMWRFQKYNPTTMGWDITNRRSGMSMSISFASQANCNMVNTCASMNTSNVVVAEVATNGCNFCGWTTNANMSYPYSLYCNDGSTKTKFAAQSMSNNGKYFLNYN